MDFQGDSLCDICFNLNKALLVQFFHHVPLNFTGDVILFIYLFALGRFSLASSLDTASAFGAWAGQGNDDIFHGRAGYDAFSFHGFSSSGLQTLVI